MNIRWDRLRNYFSKLGFRRLFWQSKTTEHTINASLHANLVVRSSPSVLAPASPGLKLRT